MEGGQNTVLKAGRVQCEGRAEYSVKGGQRIGWMEYSVDGGQSAM